jgi:predicted small metal-binding protein
MNKVINCPCGYIVRAETDDELVDQAQQHARSVHGMDLTREQALAMAQPA